jgi:hypothetical protein
MSSGPSETLLGQGQRSLDPAPGLVKPGGILNKPLAPLRVLNQQRKRFLERLRKKKAPQITYIALQDIGMYRRRADPSRGAGLQWEASAPVPRPLLGGRTPTYRWVPTDQGIAGHREVVSRADIAGILHVRPKLDQKILDDMYKYRPTGAGWPRPLPPPRPMRPTGDVRRNPLGTRENSMLLARAQNALKDKKNMRIAAERQKAMRDTWAGSGAFGRLTGNNLPDADTAFARLTDEVEDLAKKTLKGKLFNKLYKKRRRQLEERESLSNPRYTILSISVFKQMAMTMTADMMRPGWASDGYLLSQRLDNYLGRHPRNKDNDIELENNEDENDLVEHLMMTGPYLTVNERNGFRDDFGDMLLETLQESKRAIRLWNTHNPESDLNLNALSVPLRMQYLVVDDIKQDLQSNVTAGGTGDGSFPNDPDSFDDVDMKQISDDSKSEWEYSTFLSEYYHSLYLWNSLKTNSTAPTVSPTKSPTVSPTVSPTKSPTVSPSVSPTKSPNSTATATPNSTATAKTTRADVVYKNINTLRAIGPPRYRHFDPRNMSPGDLFSASSRRNDNANAKIVNDIFKHGLMILEDDFEDKFSKEYNSNRELWMSGTPDDNENLDDNVAMAIVDGLDINLIFTDVGGLMDMVYEHIENIFNVISPTEYDEPDCMKDMKDKNKEYIKTMITLHLRTMYEEAILNDFSAMHMLSLCFEKIYETFSACDDIECKTETDRLLSIYITGKASQENKIRWLEKEDIFQETVDFFARKDIKIEDQVTYENLYIDPPAVQRNNHLTKIDDLSKQSYHVPFGRPADINCSTIFVSDSDQDLPYDECGIHHWQVITTTRFGITMFKYQLKAHTINTAAYDHKRDALSIADCMESYKEGNGPHRRIVCKNSEKNMDDEFGHFHYRLDAREIAMVMLNQFDFTDNENNETSTDWQVEDKSESIGGLLSSSFNQIQTSAEARGNKIQKAASDTASSVMDFTQMAGCAMANWAECVGGVHGKENNPTSKQSYVQT